MPKEPQYKVEFYKSESTVFSDKGGYWQIWFMDNFVTFYTEDAANKACEAFNMADDMRNLKRKVRNLSSALECFKDAE